MTFDSTAPATKLDVTLLMDEIGKLYIANEAWKNELNKGFKSSERRIKRYVSVKLENVAAELKGAKKDRVSQHDDKIEVQDKRLKRIEESLGLDPFIVLK
jgi:hypothetical protein